MKKITNGRFVNQSEIRTFDDEMNEELSARKEIERNMYSALRNGEFQVFYQPKVELDSEKIYGAEALVRWVKPNGEVIPPSLFVPIFEENEFIVEMDFYVYDVVLRDMRRLMDEGCKLPIISLNASRQHFLGDDFPDKFCRLVNKYKIPHECIELEITEMSMFNNVDHLIGIINNLRRENGFRISVDDFGSGYSSLNLISLLPVDVIKIDGKFFMSNEMTGKNKKVIETILQLASTLDFDTVSEGVETKEQIEFLKRTNCSAVQGYFYYRPMTFEKFKELMSK
jgi:EAL domain-containing protein (putative c-di-GMP-specific phosphodiesterase class I)